MIVRYAASPEMYIRHGACFLVLSRGDGMFVGTKRVEETIHCSWEISIYSEPPETP